MENEDYSRRGLELLNISVDIGNGQKDVLRVFEHDEPKLVVRRFFIKNNITNQTEAAVVNKVHEFIAELIEEHQLVNMTLAARPNFPKSPCKNFGERLYRLSMQQKETTLVKNQMKRIESAKKLQETLRPTPVIDKNSEKIAITSISKSNSMSGFLTPRLASECSVETFFTPRATEKGSETSHVTKSGSKMTLQSNRVDFLKKKGSPFEIASDCIENRRNAEDSVRKHIVLATDSLTGEKRFQALADMKSLSSLHEKHSSAQVTSDSSPIKSDCKLSTKQTLESKKKSRYSELFQILSPPNPEAAFIFNPKLLTPGLARALQPLISELESFKSPLSFPEFCDCLEDLLKSATPVDKNFILASPVRLIAKAKSQYNLGSLLGPCQRSQPKLLRGSTEYKSSKKANK